MAKIIENRMGRRIIRLNTDDIINIVREYQNTTCGIREYEKIRETINRVEMYLPEE